MVDRLFNWQGPAEAPATVDQFTASVHSQAVHQVIDDPTARRECSKPARAWSALVTRLLSLVAVVAGLAVLGLSSPDVSSPAFAGCDGANPTETCTGAISGGITVNNPNPAVTTLNVNSLSNDISQISLTASGSQPPTPGGDFYTCTIASGGGGCTITPGPPPTCTASDSKSTCVLNPPPAVSPANAGPPVTITYSQPSARATVSTTSNTGAVISTSANTPAVMAASAGSDGGGGGNAYVFGSGGDGGNGANGGTVTVNVNGAVVTTASNSAGVVAGSGGGNGGSGGDAHSIHGSGGNGGAGGGGGNAFIQITSTSANPTTVQTLGDNSDALHAVSQGGHGGNAGNCADIVCEPNTGGNSSSGGTVTVTTDQHTSLVTYGQYSNGIYAASIGGFGGNGGSSSGIVAFGSSGASAGPGGAVQVNNSGSFRPTVWAPTPYPGFPDRRSRPFRINVFITLQFVNALT